MEKIDTRSRLARLNIMNGTIEFQLHRLRKRINDSEPRTQIFGSRYEIRGIQKK